MTEIMELVKPGRARTTRLAVINSRRIDSNSAEPKHRITGQIINDENLPGGPELKLVKKDVAKDGSHEDSSADEYLAKWARLKEYGFPVVPIVRKASNREVAMTDLSADGSEFYGKDRNWYPHKSPWNLKKEFNAVDLNQVQQRVDELVELSFRKQVTFAPNKDARDAFELLVHPNGQWEIITLDIGLVSFDEFSTKDSPGFQRNLQDASVFMKFLSELKTMQAPVVDQPPTKKRRWFRRE